MKTTQTMTPERQAGFDRMTAWFLERHAVLARSAFYLEDGGEPDENLVARADDVRRDTTLREKTS